MASTTLIARMVGDASKLISEMDRAEKAGGTFGAGLSKIGQIASGFVVGQGLMNLPGLFSSMTAAAAEDAASVARLQQAVVNTGDSWSQHADAMGEVIKRGQELGFTDDQTRSGLAILTAQTGSADEAMRRYALAQDLARGANIDVVTASRLLGKVTEENVNVLNRYGISVAKGATEAQLFGAISEKFSGQAKAFADSEAGRMAIMQDKMAEAKEEIGKGLLPVQLALAGALTTAVLPAFAGVADVLATVTNHMDIVVPLFGGAATVIAISLIPKMILLTVQTWAYVSALTAQAVAFAVANPLIAAAAIAAGVAVAAYLKMNVSTNEATQAQERFHAAVGKVRDNLLALIPGAQKAASAIDNTSTALDKFSFSALAAGLAEEAYTLGLDKATTANEGLVLALNHQFEHETKVNEILDTLTESFTHAKAKQEAATAASEAASDALKTQKDATNALEAAQAKEQGRSDSLAQSFARQADAANQAAFALAQQLLGMGVGVEGVNAAVAQSKATALAADSDRIARAFAAGTITQEEAMRLQNARIRGTPDPLDVELGLAPHLAGGGIVRARRGGTLVNIGEGGRDEAVVPLPSGMGLTVNVYVAGSIRAERDFKQLAVEAFAEALRGGGFRNMPGFAT